MASEQKEPLLKKGADNSESTRDVEQQEDTFIINSGLLHFRAASLADAIVKLGDGFQPVGGLGGVVGALAQPDQGGVIGVEQNRYPYSNKNSQPSAIHQTTLPTSKMAEEAGAPPSYDSLFGELKAHKASSAGTVDFAKKAKASFAKRCGGICCLIFTLILIAALLLALPIAETAIGAIHLNDCPAQKYLAIYLIVAGVLGLVSGIFSCGGRVKSHRDQDQREDSEGGSNACSCLTSLIGTFLFAWFIAGNVWVFRMKACVDPVLLNSTDCFTHNTAFASSALFCDETLYKFVFWEIIAKWIFVGVIFVIGCLGCCICCCVACCSSDKD